MDVVQPRFSGTSHRFRPDLVILKLVLVWKIPPCKQRIVKLGTGVCGCEDQTIIRRRAGQPHAMLRQVVESASTCPSATWRLILWKSQVMSSYIYVDKCH